MSTNLEDEPLPGLFGTDQTFKNHQEKQRHIAAMNSIAQEFQVPVREIIGLYEHVLIDYKARAKVEDYLPVLVYKRVKAMYRNASSPIVVSSTHFQSAPPSKQNYVR